LIDGETVIVEALPVGAPSTSPFRKFATAVNFQKSFLIGLSSEMPVEERRSIWKSVRNLEGVEVLPVCDFNAHSLLRCQNLLLTKDAFEEIQNREKTNFGEEISK
jgi:large subunit ribosomal protein L4